jgi:nitrogen fixation NifU-like protein
MYNLKVLDHFENPRHAGELADADAVVTVGNPECGDMMKLYIKVSGDRLTDVKYKTFGCAAAIATCSAAAEMVIGKTLDEALALTKEDILVYLEGLPEKKIHCSMIAPEAIRQAIAQYRERCGEKPGQ